MQLYFSHVQIHMFLCHSVNLFNARRSNKEVALLSTRKKMIFPKFIRVVFSMLSLLAIVSSHDSRKHEHYSFKDLREKVNGDSLTSEDQQRLFNSLHLLNCSDDKPSLDYRKVVLVQDSSLVPILSHINSLIL